MRALYTITFSLFLYFIPFTTSGQNVVEFEHDIAGNRELRKISVKKIADTSSKSQADSTVNYLLGNIDQIKVYPNPTYGLINIDIPESISKIEYILFDQQSKVIEDGSLNSQHSIIDISNYEKGIYLLKIIYQQTTCSYKIIKS